MKKFKDPLLQGGVPFFGDDFLMLQAELLKASMYMYASLNTEIIVSGCVPTLTGIYPSVGISAISSGYAIIRDSANANQPEIYFVPATTFTSPVPGAWIIPAEDVVDNRTLKTGSTVPIVITKTAQIVTTAPDPSAPQIAFQPLPSVTMKNLLFKNAKRIGEVIPIGLIPPFRSNPLYGPNSIPFFQQFTVGSLQEGLGKYDYDGFAICNGLNNTPDLRRRSLVGYDAYHSQYSTIGTIGGAEEVYLSKEYLPPHTHSGGTNFDGAHSHQFKVGFSSPLLSGSSSYEDTSAISEYLSTEIDGNHSHSFTTNTGDGLLNRSHDNRSPFYAALYIQRIT
ncbi:MAG TPA: hypothetical protein VNW06_02315 [Cytophagaceae bacterium]|nr:hypothetical protein [Cytophagaceae bacterium]